MFLVFDWSSSQVSFDLVVAEEKIWHSLADGRWGLQWKAGPYSKNNISIRRIPFPVETERFPYYPFDTVPFHSTFDFSIDAYPQPAPTETIDAVYEGEPLSMQTSSLSVDLIKLPSLTHQADFRKRKSLQRAQADKRFRPFARRELKMARPARVSIRARKPCVRLRLRLLGWKVRLLIVDTFCFYIHEISWNSSVFHQNDPREWGDNDRLGPIPFHDERPPFSIAGVQK